MHRTERPPSLGWGWVVYGGGPVARATALTVHGEGERGPVPDRPSRDQETSGPGTRHRQPPCPRLARNRKADTEGSGWTKGRREG